MSSDSHLASLASSCYIISGLTTHCAERTECYRCSRRNDLLPMCPEWTLITARRTVLKFTKHERVSLKDHPNVNETRG
jgi:hypothetical protein